jgi:hypothetical protein
MAPSLAKVVGVKLGRQDEKIWYRARRDDSGKVAVSTRSLSSSSMAAWG